jgi:hypothetical protein
MAEYPNWFVPHAQSNFEKYLSPYKGKPDLRFLQLGVFTGDASAWLLSNILTDTSSHLDDVDTWAGSDEEEHREFDFSDVHKTYRLKTKDFKNVASHQVDSVTYLAERRKDTYDFIYIDADHTAAGVINDAIHSWRTLKTGGIMAFDDYNWKTEKELVYRPLAAIDFFCWSFADKLEILEANEQVWVKKL